MKKKMNVQRPHKQLCLLLLMLLTIGLLLVACDNTPGADPQNPSLPPNVIEPGLQPPLSSDPEDPADPGDIPSADLFPDRGEAATVADLVAAQSKVESYYFEQMLIYPDGQVFNQVWYKSNKMKVLSSVDGYGLTENYYDYAAGTVISSFPGMGLSATLLDFDVNGADAPDNPILDDYESCTVLGGEEINRQYCLVLETPDGERLWVSTKYGFPLQVEFTDSLGEHMTVQYKNISINTVNDEDVAPPADLEVYYGGA